nr:MAG: putative E protein [Wufeng rodent arterivirus 2]
MGSLASTIGQAITDAFHEFVISIVDILLFLSIIIGLSFAMYLLVVFVRFLVITIFTRARSRLDGVHDLGKAL